MTTFCLVNGLMQSLSMVLEKYQLQSRPFPV